MQLRRKRLFALMTVAGLALAGAPVAAAECCETEFDWAAPYADAMRHHGLSHIVNDLGIQAALAAEDVCKGASAYGIADKWDLDLATAEQIAFAAYDVCPEMAR